MSRGRKPLPRAILKLRRSTALRKDRHRKPEPKAPAGSPRCPSWLDCEGKACWKLTTAALRKMGLLKTSDGATIAGLCETWSRFVSYSRELHSLDADVSMNDRRKLAAMQSEAHKGYSRACTEFGLTPSSRTKIDADVENATQDGFDTFLRSKSE